MWTFEHCFEEGALGATLGAFAHAADRLDLSDPVRLAFGICLFLIGLCFAAKSVKAFIKQTIGSAIIFVAVFTSFAFFLAPDCVATSRSEQSTKGVTLKQFSPLPFEPQVENINNQRDVSDY